MLLAMKDGEVAPCSAAGNPPLRPVDDTTLRRRAWEENKNPWAALPSIFIGASSSLGVTLINKKFIGTGTDIVAAYAIFCVALTPFTNAVLEMVEQDKGGLQSLGRLGSEENNVSPNDDEQFPLCPSHEGGAEDHDSCEEEEEEDKKEEDEGGAEEHDSYEEEEEAEGMSVSSLARDAWEEQKRLWVVAGPSILTGVTSLAVTVINQAFIRHTSATELAAYRFFSTVIMPITNVLLMGTVNALQSLCGQCHGAKQYPKLGVYLQRSWIILFACAILLLPVYVFIEPLLVALGHDPKISAVVGTISLWHIPIMFSCVFSIPLQMYLQAQSKNVIIAYLDIPSLFLHLALSWLMTVKFQLGLSGVMGSMVLCTWIPVFAQLAFVLSGGCPLTWTGFSSAALKMKDLVEIIKLSLSSGAMNCFELFYNTILVLLSGHMKNQDNVVRALSICLKINGWEMLISTGFLTAIGVRVANELGAGTAGRAKCAVVNALITCFSIGWVLFELFLHVSGNLSHMFAKNQEVANEVAGLSPVLASSILFNTVQPVLSGVAVGAGWKSVVVYITLYYLVAIPTGALLYASGLRVKGIWIAILIGKLVQIVVLMFITLTADWGEQIEIVQERLNTDEDQEGQASGGTV